MPDSDWSGLHPNPSQRGVDPDLELLAIEQELINLDNEVKSLESQRVNLRIKRDAFTTMKLLTERYGFAFSQHSDLNRKKVDLAERRRYIRERYESTMTDANALLRKADELNKQHKEFGTLLNLTKTWNVDLF